MAVDAAALKADILARIADALDPLPAQSALQGATMGAIADAIAAAVDSGVTSVTEASVRAALAVLAADPAFNNRKLTLVGAPTLGTDAARKTETDAAMTAAAGALTAAGNAASDALTAFTAAGVAHDAADAAATTANAHHTRHEPGGADAMAADAAAGTASLRSLGATGTTAAAGNDARLSDTRTPTDGSVTTAKIADVNVTTGKLALLAVTDAQVATANKDGAAGTPSMRTLGVAAGTAASGDDSRFTTVATPAALGMMSAADKAAVDAMAPLWRVWTTQPGPLTTGAGAALVKVGHALAITENGTKGNVLHEAAGLFNSYLTTGAGTDAGHIGGVFTHVTSLLNPDFTAVVRTDTAAVDCLTWVGFFSATPMTSATPSIRGFGFRFNPATDSGLWQGWTCNGSGASSTLVPLSAIAVATAYRLRAVFVPGRVDYYVNDVLLGNSTTNLPSSVSGLGWVSQIRQSGATARSIYLGVCRTQAR